MFAALPEAPGSARSFCCDFATFCVHNGHFCWRLPQILQICSLEICASVAVSLRAESVRNALPSPTSRAGVGVPYFLCSPVNTVGIFMRQSDVQMEILPADVNLDGHKSALICFASGSMALGLRPSQSLLPTFCFSSPGTAASGNGEFGDWSAFNQAPSTGELFSGPAQPSPGQPPAASNSADLFDLMGSSQATMTSSQSMNFSMMGSVSLNLPMSRSQVGGRSSVPYEKLPEWF